jgi:uncharacterized protein YkwD
MAIAVGLAGAQDKLSPDRKALDRKLDDSLLEVIRLGADLYNENEDPAGCYRLFQGALMAVGPLLDHRPDLRKGVERGLEAARRRETMSERAHALREVLDQVREEVNPKPKGEGGKAGFTLSARENGVLDLVNKERERQGLAPLKANEKLFKAARAHSAAMARLGELGHTLGGKDPGDRMRDVGYEGFGWAENVAMGQPTPRDVMQNWMDSPGHRGNILNSAYREIGIGVAADERGGIYWTQVFGTPRR